LDILSFLSDCLHHLKKIRHKFINISFLSKNTTSTLRKTNLISKNNKISLFIFYDHMNFKLLTATTLFLALGTTIPVLSADQKESEIFLTTRQCVDCNLSKGTFSEKDFKNANLQGANLASSFFISSDMRNANFSRANAKSVDFRDADLRNANFSHADISGANFCGADLRGVIWTSIVYSSNVECLPSEAISSAPAVNNNFQTSDSGVSESTAPAVTENPTSVQDTVDSVRQNVNTVRDILSIFR